MIAVPREPSSGREPTVFSVPAPRELPGIHGGMIESAMEPGEAARVLLYSPMWDGTEARFGIRGPRASHALAVMENRFLISRDDHRDDLLPALTVIPFERILSVEIGTALVLGWFVVRHEEGRTIVATTVLHGAMRGREHFLRAVREFRGVDCSAPAGGVVSMDFVEGVPPDVATDARAVLGHDEAILSLTASRESWVWVRRRRRTVPLALAPATLFCVTNRGLLLAQAEQPVWPGMLCFGVNVICIPHGVVNDAVLETRHSHGGAHSLITLQLSRGEASHALTIPLHGVPDAPAQRMMAVLEDRIVRGG